MGRLDRSHRWCPRRPGSHRPSAGYDLPQVAKGPHHVAHRPFTDRRCRRTGLRIAGRGLGSDCVFGDGQRSMGTCHGTWSPGSGTPGVTGDTASIGAFTVSRVYPDRWPRSSGSAAARSTCPPGRSIFILRLDTLQSPIRAPVRRVIEPIGTAEISAGTTGVMCLWLERPARFNAIQRPADIERLYHEFSGRLWIKRLRTSAAVICLFRVKRLSISRLGRRRSRSQPPVVPYWVIRGHQRSGNSHRRRRVFADRQRRSHGCDGKRRPWHLDNSRYGELGGRANRFWYRHISDNDFWPRWTST